MRDLVLQTRIFFTPFFCIIRLMKVEKGTARRAEYTQAASEAVVGMKKEIEDTRLMAENARSELKVSFYDIAPTQFLQQKSPVLKPALALQPEV